MNEKISIQGESLHQYKSFIPFGSGPRLCPGRNLALLEMKTALAMICRNFDLLEADQAGAVREKFTFTMTPDNLFIRFRAR